jgi:hypothetical protein
MPTSIDGEVRHSASVERPMDGELVSPGLFSHMVTVSVEKALPPLAATRGSDMPTK